MYLHICQSPCSNVRNNCNRTATGQLCAFHYKSQGLAQRHRLLAVLLEVATHKTMVKSVNSTTPREYCALACTRPKTHRKSKVVTPRRLSRSRTHPSARGRRGRSKGGVCVCEGGGGMHACARVLTRVRVRSYALNLRQPRSLTRSARVSVNVDAFRSASPFASVQPEIWRQSLKPRGFY